jgi:hypothetical protein
MTSGMLFFPPRPDASGTVLAFPTQREPIRSLVKAAVRFPIGSQTSIIRLYPSLEPPFSSPPARSSCSFTNIASQNPDLSLPMIRLMSAAKLLVLLLGLIAAPLHVLAQGTFTIRFSDLPAGQVLAEQYAAQGVHFFGGFNQPLTATAPAFLSPSGQTVGVAQNVLGVRFDYAISRISMRIAQQTFDLSSPNLSIAAWNSQGTLVSQQATGFPPNQWADINLSFGAEQDVRSGRDCRI